MIFIQETKLLDVNLRTFRYLGGNCFIMGEFVGVIGAASGLITMWEDNFFIVESKVVAQRYILLVGTIKQLNFKCDFGNIYAPNEDRKRQAFWEKLGNVINSMEIP